MERLAAYSSILIWILCCTSAWYYVSLIKRRVSRLLTHFRRQRDDSRCIIFTCYICGVQLKIVPPPPVSCVSFGAFALQHGSRRWDDGRTPAEAFRDLGLTTLTTQDAARLHSDLRAAQVKVVASRMKWAALLKETDTVRPCSRLTKHERRVGAAAIGVSSYFRIDGFVSRQAVELGTARSACAACCMWISGTPRNIIIILIVHNGCFRALFLSGGCVGNDG